jgi:hypothetical protein
MSKNIQAEEDLAGGGRDLTKRAVFTRSYGQLVLDDSQKDSRRKSQSYFPYVRSY